MRLIARIFRVPRSGLYALRLPRVFSPTAISELGHPFHVDGRPPRFFKESVLWQESSSQSCNLLDIRRGPFAIDEAPGFAGGVLIL